MNKWDMILKVNKAAYLRLSHFEGAVLQPTFFAVPIRLQQKLIVNSFKVMVCKIKTITRKVASFTPVNVRVAK